jgi:hypothetical protein
MSIRPVGTAPQENSVSEKIEGRHGLIEWMLHQGGEERGVADASKLKLVFRK